MGLQFSIELIIAIIGAITGIGALTIHILKYLKEKPKIKLSFYKTNFDSKENKLILDMILENTGNISTTIKNFTVIFGKILKEEPHLMLTEYITLPVYGGSLKSESIKSLTLPFKLEENTSFLIQIVCNFLETEIPLIKDTKNEIKVIVSHTHGKFETKKIYGENKASRKT
jgi:hypothetical protein